MSAFSFVSNTTNLGDVNKETKKPRICQVLFLTGLGLLFNASLVIGQTPKPTFRDRPIDIHRAIKPPPATRVIVEADRNDVNASERVRFTARVEPPRDGVLWYQFKFGDGAVSNWERKPFVDHVYSREGRYQVYVTVRDRPTGEFSFSENSSSITVQVKPPKEAQQPPEIKVWLEADRSSLYAGEAVKFTATIRPSVPDVEYRFSFGDGAMSDWGRSPVAGHVYSREGSYSAFVTARSLRGEFAGARLSSGFVENSRAISVRVVQAPIPPVQVSVRVEADRYQVSVGEAVGFKASISRPVRGVEYRFHFGDGTDSGWVREPAVDYRYTGGGSYQAYVLARSPRESPVNSNTITVQVQRPPEPVSVSLEADRHRVTAGEPVRFTASISRRFRDVEYQFNFGDGPPSDWMKERVAEHVYSREGTYQVNVVARGTRESPLNSNTITIQVQRPPEPLSMSLVADRYQVDVGEAVGFRASISRPVRDVEYRFHFNDGTDSGWVRERVIKHVYSQARTYQVAVEVRGSGEGPVKSDSIALQVRPPLPPLSVSLEADRHRVTAGEPVRFTASISRRFRDVEYQFNFGDGKMSHWTGESGAEHVYSSPGWREAFVIVRRGGQTIARSTTKRIEVASIDYRVFLETSKKDPVVGEGVRFHGGLVPENRTVQFRFDFGDRSQSDWLNKPTSTHAYGSSGTYGVRLIAKIGERAFESAAIPIEVAKLEVALESVPQNPQLGQTVNFNAKPGRKVEGLEYRFVFGDGKPTEWTNAFQAEHVYSEPGMYQAYVMARVGKGNIFESRPVVISIAGFHPWRIWLGILGGMILTGAGAYYLSRKIYHRQAESLSPAIQILPQLDTGNQTIESENSLEPDSAVRLKLVLDQGRQTIETDPLELQLSREVP